MKTRWTARVERSNISNNKWASVTWELQWENEEIRILYLKRHGVVYFLLMHCVAQSYCRGLGVT
jgi:hypothetical protein